MGSPTMQLGEEMDVTLEPPSKPPPDRWDAELDAELVQAVLQLGEDWKKVAERVGHGKTDKLVKKRFAIIDPGRKRGRWSPEEDELLLYWYNLYPQQWHKIAHHIPGRKDEQVAKRFRDTLDPTLKQREWTDDEDAKLMATYAELGPHWTGICAKMDGRSGMHCRNRVRKLEKRAAGPTRGNSRSASRERSTSNEAGPSRLKRTNTSSSAATSRSRSPASPRVRPSLLRQSSSSSTAGSLRAVSPFDPHQYYASLASPAPARSQSPQQQHFPPILGQLRPQPQKQSSPSSAFTEAELDFMRSFPRAQERSDTIDWSELHGFVPAQSASLPLSSAPPFPSPLSQAPLTQGYTVCHSCHGHGMIPTVTALSTSAPPTAAGYFDPRFMMQEEPQAELTSSFGTGLRFP